MIVKLERPQTEDGQGPWKILDRSGVIGTVDASPELQSMMETASGFFEIELIENEVWDFVRRVDDQVW